MKTTSKATVGRRDFLRALGAGAGVAAAAAAPLATRRAAPTPRATMRSARPATRKPIT